MLASLLGLSMVVAQPVIVIPWFAPTPPVEDVLLTDAHWFPADYDSALAMRRMAWTHRQTMKDEIQSWNPPEVFVVWERDMEWRRACWDALEDAKSSGPDAVDISRNAWRIQRLSRLRSLLGDAAYFAGLMPDPFPSYRR